MNELLSYWYDRIKYYDDEEYWQKERVLELLEQLMKDYE